jgi:PAS domain S-box-containing protein
LLDNKGVLLDANQAPLTVAGIDITDVQGRDFWDCYWWNYSDRTQARIRKAVVNAQNGESVRFDIDARVADGFLTVDFMVEGLTDDAGKLTHIIASAIDITERKRTEEQLRLSQSRFETMINRTVDGLVAFDQRGIIQFANRRFEELTDNTLHIGKTSFYSYISDPHIKSRIDELIEYVLSNGIHQAIKRRSQALVQDVCVLLPNLLPVEMALAPMLDGKDVLYLATISDVSALYSANQALEKTLNDKTVLLNEVHHRVKNNLQVMSSLLNLQANSDNTDSKTREALLDSQRRLKSMALIHELLYEREDFTHANLQLFARKLLQLLQDSMTNGNHIKIKKEFADTNLYLVLEQLVPFGFLITELITNAFKHAFVNDAQPSPMIIVRIAQVGEEVEVTIEDNGVGLPAHPHALKTSLGSELMKIFAKQLKAELTTTSDAGVTHKIRF